MLPRHSRPLGQLPQSSIPPQLSPIEPQYRAASVVQLIRFGQLVSGATEASMMAPSGNTIGGKPGGGSSDASAVVGGFPLSGVAPIARSGCPPQPWATTPIIAMHPNQAAHWRYMLMANFVRHYHDCFAA
jgi:hypothetical protein